MFSEKADVPTPSIFVQWMMATADTEQTRSLGLIMAIYVQQWPWKLGQLASKLMIRYDLLYISSQIW